jgi:hypothetical protein
VVINVSEEFTVFLFRAEYISHAQRGGNLTLMMQAVRVSETSVYFYQTARRNVKPPLHLFR